MPLWRWQGKRYVCIHDPRYQIRHLDEDGKRWPVWALFLYGQRIWEVHGVSNILDVMGEAQKYINEAAQVAV